MGSDLLLTNVPFFTTYARALDFLAGDYFPLLHQTFFDETDQKLMCSLYDEKKKIEHRKKMVALTQTFESQIVNALVEAGIPHEQQKPLITRLKPVFFEQHYALNQATRQWDKFGSLPKNPEASSWQEEASYHDPEMEKFLNNISDIKVLTRYYSNREGGGGRNGPIGILCDAIVVGCKNKHNELHIVQNVGEDKEKEIPCDCFKESIYKKLKENKKIALVDTFSWSYWAIATVLGQAATWIEENKVAEKYSGKDSLVRLFEWLKNNPGDLKIKGDVNLEKCIEISTNYRCKLSDILELYHLSIPLSPLIEESAPQKGLRPRIRSLSSPDKIKLLIPTLHQSSPIPAPEKKIAEKKPLQVAKRTFSNEKKGILMAYLESNQFITEKAASYFHLLKVGFDLREKEALNREQMTKALATTSTPSEESSPLDNDFKINTALIKTNLLGELRNWADIFEKIKKILDREMTQFESMA